MSQIATSFGLKTTKKLKSMPGNTWTAVTTKAASLRCILRPVRFLLRSMLRKEDTQGVFGRVPAKLFELSLIIPHD
jgi:hypothetical protein